MTMLKALLKKQFMQLFRPYFINRKTGEPQPAIKTVLMFAGFGALLLFIAFAFFMIAGMIGANLIAMGMDWLYFSIMSILAIAFGVFGSVFNTYAEMYLAKDNELLIPMPIPARVILLSRVASVYGLGFMYSSSVWIPTLLFYWIFGTPTALAVIFGILMTFINSLFITVLTCALGWVVALISGKLKNKSVITVLISIVFLGLYYVVCFRMQDILMSLVENSMMVGEKVRAWGNLLYQLGMAATGNVLGFAIFTAITLVLAVICMVVLEKSFFKMVAHGGTTQKVEYKKTAAKQTSIEKALLYKEWKRFTGSSTYMLNCGLGIVFLLAAAVLAVINANSLTAMLDEITEMMPVVRQSLPLILAGIICMLVSMNMISTPSISLEGKTLWQLKTMPIRPYRVLNAKLSLHLLVNVIPSLITVICIGLVLSLDPLDILLVAVYVFLYICIDGALGLILGLMNPNFSWTSETQPIKQGVNILIAMFGGWVLSFGVPALYFLVADKMECYQYFMICIVVFALLFRMLSRWMQTKGEKVFQDL